MTSQAIARFEFRQISRSALFVTAIFLLIALGFIAVATPLFDILLRYTLLVNRDAPWAIVHLAAQLCIPTLLAAGFLAGAAFVRDDEHDVSALVSASPASDSQIITGRLIGVGIAALLLLAAPLFGIALGAFAPWIEITKIGGLDPSAVLAALGIFILPNTIWVVALAFVLATTGRRISYVFAGLVAFVAAYAVSIAFLGAPNWHVNIEREFASALADPFGLSAFQAETRSWGPGEKNAEWGKFGSALGINRLLWLAIGIALLVWGIRRFHVARLTGALPPTAISWRSRSRANGRAKDGLNSAFARIAITDFKAVFGSLPFVAINLVSLIGFVAYLNFTQYFFDIRLFAFTSQVLAAVDFVYHYPILIAVAYFTTEIVWRDRASELAEVVDATPVASGVAAMAKISAALGIAIMLLIVPAAIASFYQWIDGVEQPQPWAFFLHMIAYRGPAALQAVIATLFLHMIISRRMVAFGVAVIIVLLPALLPLAGIESHLLIPNSTVTMLPRELDFYSGFWTPHIWFSLFWTVAAFLLGVLSVMLWRRGVPGSARSRFRQSLALASPFARRTSVLGLLSLVAIGSWIGWNTHIRSAGHPDFWDDGHKAAKELKYAAWESRPHPTITGETLNVDILSAGAGWRIDGQFDLRNLTQSPVSSFLLWVNESNTVLASARIEGGRLSRSDAFFGTYIIELDRPMLPGETRKLQFVTRMAKIDGFQNQPRLDQEILPRAAFLDANDVLPHIGISRWTQVDLPEDRKALGLNPEKGPHKSLNDPDARRELFEAPDSAFFDSDIRISAPKAHVAVARGELVGKTAQGEKAVWHYRSDAPSSRLDYIVSGEFEVAKGRAAGVDIEILHSPQHRQMAADYLKSFEKVVTRFSDRLGHYPFSVLRIIERSRSNRDFSRYAYNVVADDDMLAVNAGKSGPGALELVTPILGSMAMWQHAFPLAGTEGAPFLIVAPLHTYYLEMNYGSKGKRELARLRSLLASVYSYERARGFGITPVYRTADNEAVRDGLAPLMLQTVQAYIGQAAFDRAMQGYYAEGLQRAKAKPGSVDMMTSLDLVRHFQEQTPVALRASVDDFLSRVTRFTLRVTSAKASRRADGRYDVCLSYDARKAYVTENGQEKTANLSMPLPVGVFSLADPKNDRAHVLHDTLHASKSGKNQVKVTVNGRPATAGVDPLFVLLDFEPGDNEMPVTVGPGFCQ